MDSSASQAVNSDGLVVFHTAIRGVFGYRQKTNHGAAISCDFDMSDSEEPLQLRMCYRKKEFVLEAIPQLSGNVAQIFWITTKSEVDGGSDDGEDHFVRIRNGEYCVTISFLNSDGFEIVTEFINVAEQAKDILNAKTAELRETKLKMLSSGSDMSAVVKQESLQKTGSVSEKKM